MALYLNELAPWEKKKEYFHNIESANNLKTLSKAFNLQTKNQLSASSEIIASQSRINEGINELTGITSDGFNRVIDGLSSLQASFEWGISEAIWQLEQTNTYLQQIVEILMAPLDNQAKERKWRAEEAFRNGWIDDAEEEFLESEKLNKYDFSIHISLGMIYLFHIIDKKKAYSYFEKALKYSKPKSSYYSSYSLLYMSLIKFDFGNIEEATYLCEQAIELSPDFGELYYRCAIYNVLSDNSHVVFDTLFWGGGATRHFLFFLNSNWLSNFSKTPLLPHHKTLFFPCANRVSSIRATLFSSEFPLLSSRGIKGTPMKICVT